MLRSLALAQDTTKLYFVTFAGSEVAREAHRGEPWDAMERVCLLVVVVVAVAWRLLACLLLLLLHASAPSSASGRAHHRPRRPKSKIRNGQNARKTQKSAADGAGALRWSHRESCGMYLAPLGGVESQKGVQNQAFSSKIHPLATPTLDVRMPGW